MDCRAVASRACRPRLSRFCTLAVRAAGHLPGVEEGRLGFENRATIVVVCKQGGDYVGSIEFRRWVVYFIERLTRDNHVSSF